jgi:hypothetical protein
MVLGQFQVLLDFAHDCEACWKGRSEEGKGRSEGIIAFLRFRLIPPIIPQPVRQRERGAVYGALLSHLKV